MSRRFNRKQPLPLLEKVEIIDAGAEGKSVGKVESRVVFIPYGVPGDVVDVQVTRKKSSFYEGRIVHFHEYSTDRIEPVCSHFGLCGGCRWQNMSYDDYMAEEMLAPRVKAISNLPLIGMTIGNNGDWSARFWIK